MVFVLLDVDGVMVTTPSWKIPDFLDDGFMKFNEKAVQNLAKLLSLQVCHLVITSTHRVNYSEAAWISILEKRGLQPAALSKLNDDNTLSPGITRCTEIQTWYEEHGSVTASIIIDDDNSLHDLPPVLKEKWVQTFPLKGFDDAAFEQAAVLLQRQV